MKPDLFVADLHIHSKFSRATARDLDLEHIYVWAQLKGIAVVATGDFTHPEWYAQIVDKLEPAEAGLYRLKTDIARIWDASVPSSCRAPVRFMLSCEISNIYKKGQRTRKNHNLVFFPDRACVRRFNDRLASIGNIMSDGRPILGLDSRNLLEIVLDISTDGYLIPAHIWTPWFSLFGSKSGFDALSDCFEDLSTYIFAAETGLSSDPAMNWRVADLDHVTLISNSDAHSPSKLGREANLFRTEMTYHAIRSAMQDGDAKRFVGTFEFFPEEGKYHVDGHRNCGVCFMPAQTRAHSGVCPVCGKPLTKGVLHRVEELACRPQGYRSPRAFPFHRLIPLEDLLAEIYRVGSQSKKVKQAYHGLLEQLGSEFDILHRLDRDVLDAPGIPLLSEAIARMREDRITFSPGYDGQYGRLQIFSERERDRLMGQRSLFAGFEKAASLIDSPPDLLKKGSCLPVTAATDLPSGPPSEPVGGLNDDQWAAVDEDRCHLMIVAGPGTGKTRTLTHKIARLIQAGTEPERMLAVTFTNKAAREMQERLRTLLVDARRLPFVGTFHGLGYRILSAGSPGTPLCVVDEAMRRSLVADALNMNDRSRTDRSLRVDDLMAWIVAAKQQMRHCDDSLEGLCPPDRLDAFAHSYRIYEELLRSQHLVDFEDLIFRSVKCLEEDAAVAERFLTRYDHLFIDEYQDINAGQYRLTRRLAGTRAAVCVIGDPDQSIYGFRGSDINCFKWFMDDFPDARTIFLRRNYRSTRTILDVSAQVIGNNPEVLDAGHRRAVYSHIDGERHIHVIEAVSEKAEAVAIGKTIEAMVGGTGFLSLDAGVVDGSDAREPFAFNDFAVLFRTRQQVDPIGRLLENAGIPCLVVDRRRVLDHPGIKPLLSVFNLLLGMGTFHDLQSVVEAVSPSIPPRTVDSLKAWAYRNGWSLAEALVQVRRMPIPRMGINRQQRLFDFLLRMDEWRHRLDNGSVVDTLNRLAEDTGANLKFQGDREFESGFRHVIDVAGGYTDDPTGFLAATALSSDTDTYDPRIEKVTLSTMHAAKGLEFPVVFVAGCENGWIPFRSVDRPVETEEERRLFYVAITRAKQHLFLTNARVRIIHGSKRQREPSPFVKEIENRYKQVSAQTGRKPDTPHQVQLSLF